MKKLLILSIAILTAISCSNDSSDDSVNITTLEGSSFSLSEFGMHTFPAVDIWVIEDQSATTADFEGLSAAIEYISNNESDREIELEFSSLTALPDYAIFGVALLNDGFRNFSSLSSVSAPYAVSVGSYAFMYCSGLTSIDLPIAESLGIYAFASCSTISEVELPSATAIGHSAFSGCLALDAVSMPLVETIGDQAFRLCGVISSIELPSVLSIGSAAFAYCSAMSSFEAPELLSIGSYAFCEATTLSTLSIPLVEQIGDCAFIECDALTNFTITSQMTTLGAAMFNSCDLLTEIIIENDDYMFDGGILYSADQSVAYEALQSIIAGDLVLSESVVTLGDRAFYDCSALTSIELPSVRVIPTLAFAYCSNIATATITAATEFEAEAFYDCQLITTFTAPEVTIIGSRAFYNCDSFVDLSLATSPGVMLESIDLQAFYGTYTEDTTLTVGEANASLVTYGDTLTVGDFEMEFPEIIVLTI